MIQVRFKVNMAAGELAGTGSPGDIINLIDSSRGEWIGVRYDITTEQFEVYDSGGAATVVIPYVAVANQDTVFTLNIKTVPAAMCLVYMNGTYFGSVIPTIDLNVDTLYAGAINTNGQDIDRKIHDLLIGSSPGIGDLFDDDGYSGDTLVPPFDSVTGDGLSVSTISLRIANAGTDAYAVSDFSDNLPPPPVTDTITVIDDPSTLSIVGDSDWKQAGPRKWHRDGWELDRLVIPVRGSIETQDAYLDNLPLWGKWSVDPNMFLADYPSDDHKQFPTISLTFMGKRNGVLPPPRNEVSSSVQQISGVVISDSYILTFGLPPHWQAKITYTGPVGRYTVWSRTPPNFDEITAPIPAQIGPADIASLVIGGIDYSVWTAAAARYDDIVAWVLRWFFQRTVKYTASQEIVPGQYYRATVTQQVLLLPVQEEIVSA